MIQSRCVDISKYSRVVSQQNAVFRVSANGS
jgi:hypothetical protein